MAKKRPSKRKPSLPLTPLEQGAITSKRQGRINIALVYPNTYRAGMSNLGFQTVYALFNAHHHVACHRFFLPDQDIEREGKVSGRKQKHRSEGLHGLAPHPLSDRGRKQKRRQKAHAAMPQSVETGMPLSHYDIIAFSISFENDYLHLITLLTSAHLPTRAADRDNTHPLIIAGGVASFLNPEPIAPFIDCFLMGEAEVLIPGFIKHYDDTASSDVPHAGIEKNALLEMLAQSMKGVYVPEFYKLKYPGDNNIDQLTAPPCPISPEIPKTVEVQRIASHDTISTTTQILTSNTAFDNTYLIETGRGCPHGCRFCSAGFIYRPPRFTPKERVIDAMKAAGEMTNKIGLVSAAVSDHPDINAICTAGIAMGHVISFSSLRLDNLTDKTLDTLVNASVKTATIAPEAGSERMRRIINKKITETQILSAVERIVARGILNIKLYFMVGLPFEIHEDVQAIVDLTLKIKQAFLEASRKKGKIGTITLSINPFIPKPATPFQWAAMDRPSVYKKKVKHIREALKREGNVVVNSESPKTAEINALLAQGDRRMADVLERAADVGWPQTLKDDHYFAKLPPIHHPLDLDAPLPWEILDTGIKKSFLINEFKRAEMEKMTSDCPLKKCSQCGICKK